MIRPIDIRKLAREKIRHLQQIARRRDPIKLSWLGCEWQIRLSELSDVREGLSEMFFDWGGACAKFRCDESWIVQISQAALGIDDDSVLQGQWRMIILDAAFSEISSLIERFTRKRFVQKTLADATDPIDWEKFSVEMDAGGRVSKGELWLDSLGVGFLSIALQAIPVASTNTLSWGNLPIKVRFLIGETRIALSMLQGLARRDVIVIDESFLVDGLDELTIEFGDKYFSSGRISERKVTIIDVLGKRMNEFGNTDLDQQEAFGEISIRLTFDLGERSVQLSDLVTIGPGHVFDLGRDVRRAVFIRANGKIIGEGELVDIDGQIGVSVLNIGPVGPSER